jgi:hypothetical protein
MPEYEKRLYVVLYPTAALVGSQYTPEQLAKHYTVGPTRHYRGKVIFAEIDPSFRHPYFDIDEAMKAVRPHEDGRPKATRYISSYRVLEHIDFSAIGSLYLSTPSGTILRLEHAASAPRDDEPGLRIYAEITPLRMLVLSRHDFVGFGRFITEHTNEIGAPRFLYTQLDVRVDDFLAEFEANPFMVPPIPNLHPSVLRDAIIELRSVTYKSNKGLSLQSNLDGISYKMITNGFMFASQTESRFYPMPGLQEIAKQSQKFWRSM